MRRLGAGPRFAVLALLLATPALAQTPPPQPPAPKPYKAVAITVPVPMKDAAFDAFRNKVAEIARRKDRAQLAKIVVPKGFFWDREQGDIADAKKSGLDNLTTALALERGDGVGWDMMASFADDPSASASPGHKNAMCAPGDPGFDRKAFTALLNATQTAPQDWGYPLSDKIEVRATPRSGAPVADTIGLHFVRVLPDNSPFSAIASLVKIATPSGKAGYIPADTLAPLGNDQICYVKDGGGWKIGGYVGAGDAQ